MARKPEEISDPNELATYYLATAEFPSGFMTQYTSSMITGSDTHQSLAPGYPLGKRFKSAEVVRVGDGKRGAPRTPREGRRALARLRLRRPHRRRARRVGREGRAPVRARFTPVDADVDAVFDVKAVYQQPFEEIEVTSAPALFQPKTGPPRTHRLGEGLRRRPQQVDRDRHLRRARALPRRRRDRGAPRPVRGGDPSARRHDRAGRVPRGGAAACTLIRPRHDTCHVEEMTLPSGLLALGGGGWRHEQHLRGRVGDAGPPLDRYPSPRSMTPWCSN